MANKIQYIDNVGGDHIFPVTHERGVLDSNGVTLESKLLRPLAEMHLQGAGTTYHSSIRNYNVIPGHTYRFHIRQWPHDDVSGGTTEYMFCIYTYADGTPTQVLLRRDSETLADYYDVDIPADAEYMVITGKVDSGEEGIVALEDITLPNEIATDTAAKMLRPLSEMSIVGDGKYYVGKGNPEVLAGHTYRLWVKSWPHTDVSGGGPTYMFIVYSNNGTSSTELMRVNKTGTLKEYYDVTLKNDAVKMIVGGCVDSGELGIVAVEDITISSALAEEVEEIGSGAVARRMELLDYEYIDKAVNNSGVISTNPNSFYAIHKYAVTGGADYRFSSATRKNITYYTINWFDEEGTFISHQYPGSTAERKIYNNQAITAPEDAAFLYMNVDKTQSASYALYEVGDVIPAQEIADKVDALGETRSRLRMLVIGNSYAQDVLSYVPFLLDSMGRPFDVTIGILYKASSTIAGHIVNFENEDAAYTFFYHGGGTGAWQSLGTKSIQWALANYEWDLVVTHSYSGDTSAERLGKANKFANLIYTVLGYNVKLGWMMHELRPSNANQTCKGDAEIEEGYGIMAGKIQEILANTPYEVCFVPGTAIQNARSITALKALGAYADNVNNTSGYGYLCYSDGNHLQEGLPCQIAAYSVILTMLDILSMPAKSVFGETTRVDSDWISGKGIPGSHGTPVGSDDDNCRMGQLCAIMAHKKPFEITDMNPIVNPTW